MRFRANDLFCFDPSPPGMPHSARGGPLVSQTGRRCGLPAGCCSRTWRVMAGCSVDHALGSRETHWVGDLLRCPCPVASQLLGRGRHARAGWLRAFLDQYFSVFVGDVECLVEHLSADLRVGLPIETAAVRRVPATRLAITLIAPLRNEHAAAAWAFAAAVLWAGLAHDAFAVRSKEKKPRPRENDRGFLEA